jgi:hypothetical protein
MFVPGEKKKRNSEKRTASQYTVRQQVRMECLQSKNISPNLYAQLGTRA